MDRLNAGGKRESDTRMPKDWETKFNDRSPVCQLSSLGGWMDGHSRNAVYVRSRVDTGFEAFHGIV